MYFVRTQGCDVGCYFCDTKYTWRQMTKPEEMISEESIIKRVQEKAVPKWICITGGEPYEQDLSKLVSLAQQSGYKVHVETSGTEWQDIPIDWICLSPKDLFSKKKTKEEFKEKSHEIKCVVTKDSDVDYYLNNYYQYCNTNKPFIIQVVDNNAKLVPMVFDKLSRLPNTRIMIQQHKILDLR
jgi:7-carboxy-7-deazaguanine synthase